MVVTTVVSRGTPVATMGPAAPFKVQRLSAHKALLARLQAQKARLPRSKVIARDWSRDDLYAEE